MKIFISWSGDRGKFIAERLRTWLHDVIQIVTPWVSSEDIDPGTRWNSELAQELEKTDFGIICLTPESARAPWILFEAGALAKTVGSARVCPYLVGIEPHNLQEPLSQFDAVIANQTGTWKLVRGINKALDEPYSLSDESLRKAFEKWWPDLERALDHLPAACPSEESFGLERVCRSRVEALAEFAGALHQEIDRCRQSKGAVYIAGTSMRGFMVTSAKRFDGPWILKDLNDSGCELHIMLTHPETAELRAKQEKRRAGAIASEVRATVEQLLEIGVQPHCIKYYRGAPTVFGIATSEMMLLNPYPYESESHRCMSLVVRKTQNDDDIYHQYMDAHFKNPWRNAISIQDIVESSINDDVMTAVDKPR